MTISRSTRPVTTVATSAQKRRDLYISSTDPRNNPRYIANYPGQVIVLDPTTYAQYLKKQGVNLNILNDIETEVSTLHPPTNIYWDPTDTASQVLSTGNNGSSTWGLLISFDPSVDDVSTDGTIEYEYQFNLSDSSTVSNSNSTGGTQSQDASGNKINTTSLKPGVTLSSISTVSHSSSLIQLKWNNVPGCTGYHVSVTGANQLGSNGANLKIWTSQPTPTSTYHYFSLHPDTGKYLSGTYTFAISVMYNGQTTKAVTYHATV